MLEIINGNITEIQADAIVNASNGVGFMGGFIGRFVKLKGVAEAIHFKTKGQVEKQAKSKCRRIKLVPRLFCGYRAGDVFVTDAGTLSPNYIIHAVTMRYPGFSTNIDVIKKLLPKILNECNKLNVKSIAIPLLGSGVGGLSPEKVLDLYKDFFKDVKNIDIKIVIYKK